MVKTIKSSLICCCSYSQTNANTRLNIIIFSEFKTWVTENRYQGPVSCMYQFWFNTKRILNKMSGAYPKVIFFQDNLDFGGVLAWFHRLWILILQLKAMLFLTATRGTWERIKGVKGSLSLQMSFRFLCRLDVSNYGNILTFDTWGI